MDPTPGPSGLEHAQDPGREVAALLTHCCAGPHQTPVRAPGLDRRGLSSRGHQRPQRTHQRNTTGHSVMHSTEKISEDAGTASGGGEGLPEEVTVQRSPEGLGASRGKVCGRVFRAGWSKGTERNHRSQLGARARGRGKPGERGRLAVGMLSTRRGTREGWKPVTGRVPPAPPPGGGPLWDSSTRAGSVAGQR